MEKSAVNIPAEFTNVYEDTGRAAAYATLEFPGTYYLAFRDLPLIFQRYVQGKRALDFGCGAGRSTRFLAQLGYSTIGIDIAEEMLVLARQRDPHGDFRRVDAGELYELDGPFDLIFSAFTFDNVPTPELKVKLLRGLRALLGPEGCIVNLVSTPDIYRHDWASFTTSCFPGNLTALRGDAVYTIMNDVADRRPVHDVLWPDDAYRETYRQAGLKLCEVHKPMGRTDEPYPWVNETQIAPWAIYVLQGES